MPDASVEIPEEFLEDDEEYLTAQYTLSQTALHPLNLASSPAPQPSSPPYPFDDTLMDTDVPFYPSSRQLDYTTGQPTNGGRSFAEVVLNSSCPSCAKARGGMIVGSERGAGCEICGWGIEMLVLKATEEAFTLHSFVTSSPPFLPLLPATQIDRIYPTKAHQKLTNH